MLDIIIVIILLCWIGGFIFNVAGGLIHTLLVIALIAFIYRMVRGREP